MIELTIKRPNGEIEKVATEFAGMTKVLFGKIQEATRNAGRGEVLAWELVDTLVNKGENKMTTIANEYEISTETVFSGTNGSVPESILGYGRFSSEFDNRFGGIFASPEREVAESHGETVFEMSLGRYISADDFRHLAFYSDHAEDVEALMLAVIDDERCVSDIDADLMLELIAEDENVFDLDDDVASELLEQFGFDSLGELSWDIQGLKGEVCRRMGFDSVGMEDEHGESILVLNLI